MTTVFDDFSKDVQTTFSKARQDGAEVDKGNDFEAQQKLYQKYSGVYDEYLMQEDTKRFQLICEMVEGLVEDKTQASILDYGCGSGNMGELLVKKYGFKTVDGLEPNDGLLEVAREKGSMRKLFKIASHEDHSELGERSYDVLFSSGVFFCSPSHPDLSCLSKLCKVVKKGGFILICSGEYYLKYVQMAPAEQLEKEGKIKIFPNQVFEGYRRSTPQEQGDYINGVILKYQVLC